MFAAFSSTSDYGMMTDYWRRWLSRLSRDDDDDDEEAEKKEDPQFEKVIELYEGTQCTKILRYA